ncbi:RadC family protein [Aerococcus sanguinicola]|uniref:RadC family protein n=1 Tax=unclassified Aerococcus TaxID=2618060 RepID=UPI0008A3E6CC|nr:MULTISPECIES: DNA repair protein RadC [unclassified Aerococcus]MDK6232842.1 DNA repair protein RadC [Aerococcus sp. UMB10185]MDK6805207.1 DNA repair protein RadC [Aerococcus sp. UMB7834]MDK6855732.1 DNA repair protein RadC [Aerococcus sp. UMB7533]MDK8502473.1 DNA repair protein RadC [Aerococcus sp. UMB1112A]OFN02573.1 hypothetical protein HMPREF2626_01270 [Aerococcus sp. HMSC062A02]
MTDNLPLILQFKDLDKESRPRERLIAGGAERLADYELLAILLRTGSRQASVLDLAVRVLKYYENLYDLRYASIEELTKIPGIGQAKAAELLAALEFGKRVNQAQCPKFGQIGSSQEAGNWLLNEMRHYKQEHVLVLFLNTKHEVIRQQTIFIGSLNMSVAHPREIYHAAVRCCAARIIVGHNHPSGNPSPSQADIDFTQRLLDCGSLLGIDLLDHIVVGSEDFVSLREFGIF